jgi:phage gpG-like protein
MASEGIDLQKVVLRIAHRIRAIAIKERLVPVGQGSRAWTATSKRGKTLSGGRATTGGELRKSIHVSPVNGGAMVGANKVYARAVHEGRKAMLIRPRRKRALYWNGARHPVKKVFQRKREGKPFFRNAVDRFERNLDKETESIALDGEMAAWLAANLKKQGLDVREA